VMNSLKSATAIVVSLLLATVCGSCRSGQKWIKNGEVIGTIQKKKTGSGYEYFYKDLDDRLKRHELRDSNEELWEGACTRLYDYHDSGKLAEIRHYDAEMSLTENDSGYAKERYKYSDTGGNRTKKLRSYYDGHGKVTASTAGHSRELYTYENSRIKSLAFLDERHRSVGVSHNGVSNTARLEYSYLQGVTPLTYEVYYDCAGTLVEKKRTQGLVSRTVTSTSSSYYGSYYHNGHYHYVPVYTHQTSNVDSR